MTNNEYEKECNMRTLTPYGEHELKNIADSINEVERRLSALQERRREVINKYGLNKCKHAWVEVSNVDDDSYHWLCESCGERNGKERVIRRMTKDGMKLVDDDQHSHLCD